MSSSCHSCLHKLHCMLHFSQFTLFSRKLVCCVTQVTLKSGIENMLMHYIPEVKEVVEAPPDEAQSAGLSEFAKLEAQLSN